MGERIGSVSPLCTGLVVAAPVSETMTEGRTKAGGASSPGAGVSTGR